MLSPPYPHSGYQPHASLRSRATSALLAIAAVALIVVMLLKMGAFTLPPKPEARRQVLLNLMPEAKAPSKAVNKLKRPSGGGAPRKPTPRAAAAAAAPPPTPKPPIPWNVTPISPEEFASSDIASKPSRDHATEQSADSGTGTGEGKNSGVVYGPGEGPGGEQLFNAEWYSEPTHAQMAFYLPPGGAPPGWGMIACKTAARYHVEDCRELGETPGSGLARSLRQAAWQFLVRPPRVNGRPMIGAWVRIRFDFTREEAK